MRHLLDDLLWLARFDASRGAPNAEPVDVATLAAQAVDRFGPVAEARHLRLTVESAPGGHVVSVPPEWLDRLLGVLLDNACSYSPEGGAVTVRVEPDGSRIRLTVDDSGPGIAPEERDRIFDRFHRATEKPGGAGLGLAIGDAIVRATQRPVAHRHVARRRREHVRELAAGVHGAARTGGSSTTYQRMQAPRTSIRCRHRMTN